MEKLDKRYLVYRSVNGTVTAEVQYGEHTTGENQKKDKDELERYEILDHNNYLIEIWQKIYPYKGERK